ncbi:MAG: transcriptional repressor [Candidatus Pacebacteria bacterium]|nr:transcriptional repressor [Candidatus Paceibacterota bacterium]
MRELLKEKGYKITPARLSILEIFTKNDKPLDAENVCQKLLKTKEGKGIDPATVYRTLLAFTESGILKRVDLRKESVAFELADTHHHHIVCTKCETVEDFENQEIEQALEKIIRKSAKFKKIKEHSLELFGLCKACS